MTDRKKGLLVVAVLLALLVLFFSKILFTDRIIRAPDIINEFYWSVLDVRNMKLWDIFKLNLFADWDIYQNSGFTVEGGYRAGGFLFYKNLILYLFKPPASVAWFIVLHLFFGAAGTYLFCRAIGASRVGAFLGGLIFALSPENASLINAGHVMKIATISFAPWAFFCLEKAFQKRRVVWFMTTALILAFQFFNVHWQIAYYTCLAIGAYAVIRSIGILYSERRQGKKLALRLIGLNLVTLFFFLSTVAISLAPLAKWSTETTRGVQSGANLGKGGLNREEAMMWSMPPEELGALVVPGFFGLSRQEAGENPPNIKAYYWGRMVFTQTLSYMGLLPWLLAPLPLIFRRDRYTWLAAALVAGGILFSMGKYTFLYELLFDYFPGVNRFRVPKMMMFIPVFGLAAMAARGLDLLRDESVRDSRQFKRYVYCIMAVPVFLLVLLGVLQGGKEFWIERYYSYLAQPTRYEQGPQLVVSRWDNLVAETAIAAGLAALCAAVIFAWHRKWLTATLVSLLLVLLYVGDVWRVNDKFMFLVDVPEKAKGVATPAMEFLAGKSKDYRVLPLNADPMHYVSHKMPVFFTSNPVQMRRWQEFLDAFDFASVMPDILNVRYLVYERERYEQDKAGLGAKYQPVFTSPDGSEVVLENRNVFPKAWLVPSTIVFTSPVQTFGALRAPEFDPRRMAVVETPPPLPMASPGASSVTPGEAVVTRYEGERISLTARSSTNALLVLGEKYYRGWKATVDGKPVDIHVVNHVLRGVYLTPGEHKVEFRFDPLPFKVGKYLTLASFALFSFMLAREVLSRRRGEKGGE